MKYYSFIILKPDALERNLVEEIIERFKQNDYSIEMIGYKRISEELIYKHYHEAIERFGDIMKEKAKIAFVNKYAIPIVISHEDENIIANARSFIGATDPFKAEKGTIRGDLGTDSLDKAMAEGRFCENLIHASDSKSSFKDEVTLWLPNIGADFSI